MDTNLHQSVGRGRQLAIHFFDIVAGLGWLIANQALNLTGSYTRDPRETGGTTHAR